MAMRSRPIFVLSLTTLAASMVGCGASQAPGLWNWTQQAPLDHPGPTEAELGSVSGSVAVFPGGGYGYGIGPESTRRDSLLMARGSGETVPNRLDWPRTPAPSLDRTRTVRTGRNADTWTYPTQGRDGYGGGHGHGSGHGHGHGPYGEWRIRP